MTALMLLAITVILTVHVLIELNAGKTTFGNIHLGKSTNICAKCDLRATIKCALNDTEVCLQLLNR